MRKLKERWRIKIEDKYYLWFEYIKNICYIDIIDNRVTYFDSKEEAIRFVEMILNSNQSEKKIINAFTDETFTFESIYVVVEEDIDQDE